MHPTALAAAALALATGPVPPPQAPTAFSDVDAYIEARLEQTDVPGAAWAVVSSGNIEHQAAWGVDGGGEPVTDSTPFLWGSVAKPVTATAVMTLVEAGRIDLDEPARTYLPDFALADPARAERVTVRHLLEQTSGIPEGTGVTDDFDTRSDPYGEALAELSDAEPFADPGTDFEYASANYLVLGALVEAVSGTSYEDYLREAVLDPLGMDTAIADAESAASVPDGHTFVFGQPVAIDAPFDPTGPSYGYLGGSATDLAAFAAASLPGGAGAVSADALTLMQTPAVPVNERIDYGLGWKIDDNRNADLGATTVFHTGGAPGYSAAVILLPELDLAVTVVQNAYGHFQDGPLVETALGAARVAAGGDGYELATDWLYPGSLAAIAALLLLGIFLTARTVRQLRRGVKPVGRTRSVWAAMAAWTIAGFALAYTAVIAIPAMAPSRTLFQLMAPDLAWGLYSLASITLALAAAKLFHGAARLRRNRTRSGTA